MHDNLSAYMTADVHNRSQCEGNMCCIQMYINKKMYILWNVTTFC